MTLAEKLNKRPKSLGNKTYSEMSNREKKTYKRYLNKYELWDSEVVFEYQEKMGILIISDKNKIS